MITKSIVIISKILTLIILFYVTPLYSQWTVQNYDTNYTLGSINFINENTGFAGGEGRDPINQLYKGIIYRTTNSGGNWYIVFLDINLIIWNIHFINDITGYAVGGLYSNQPKIFKTTNTGYNWFYYPPNEIKEKINSFTFFDNVVYATCVGSMYKSNNNGINWSRILMYSYSYYSCSYFKDVNTGWCSAGDGNIYKTTNGGNNWDHSLLSYSNPHKIQFVNSLTGFLIYDSSLFHDNSKLLKTTNGGLNWVQLNTGFNYHHWSLYFVNENTGYLSGSYSHVFKTTNSGNTWNISLTGVQELFIGLHFLDAYTGYACGSNSIIIKTTNGGFIGIPPISTETPKDFSLFQNYPNPFNPTTNIKFAIPKSSFVKLAIFDMLGREVEILVNDNVSQGTYEVKWDAAKFSSGIYFYKLTTNDFSIAKKMSLIK